MGIRIGCFASSTFQGVFYHRQNFLVAAKKSSSMSETQIKFSKPQTKSKKKKKNKKKERAHISI